MSLVKLFFAGALVGASASFGVTSLMYDKTISGMNMKEKERLIEAQRVTLEEHATSLQQYRDDLAKLQELNQNNEQALERIRVENGELARRIAAGDAVPRVRIVPQACPTPGTDATAEASSVGNDASAELAPAARQDYLDLRTGISKQREQVTYLQKFIDTFCQ